MCIWPFFNSTLEEKWCYKCNDESEGGQIVCNSTNGCSDNYVDNHFYCESCKTGFFNYEWQCLPCSRGDFNCIQCHFNISENGFNCDKCKDNFYLNNNGVCNLISYDEYPEVTPLIVNMDFLKQKMNHVYTVKQEKLEGQNVMNVNL